MFLQEIEKCFIASLPPEVVDSTLGRKENEQEVHRSAILAILLIQISRCLKKKCSSKHKRGKFTYTGTKLKKCDTVLQFQAQEREIHQYQYHWTLCRLDCEPCNYK